MSQWDQSPDKDESFFGTLMSANFVCLAKFAQRLVIIPDQDDWVRYLTSRLLYYSFE